LHFNEKRRKFDHNSNALSSDIINEDELDEIDTLKIDDHSRITFTKKMKKVFSVEPEDIIKVYHNRKKDEIIFNVLRRGSIVERFFCKRMEKDGQDVVSSYGTFTPYQQQGSTIPKPNSNNINYLNDWTNNKSYFQKDTPNIMIVDDEEDVLTTFKLLLNQAGVNVETFSSSRQAITHFVQLDPLYYDLIILDIKMPVINGFKLYNIMEGLGVDSSKFLFVSTLDCAEDFVQTLPGFRQTNFIKKPIESETLLQKIKEALNGLGSLNNKPIS
jgi:CheY-like chemotaxis protein